MKVLAIDTSTASATVAISEDEVLLGTTTVCLKRAHSQIIMVLIEELLNKLELTPTDIDLFCAAQGPGSFTGIRVGIAAIKGLADGAKKPCIGVSTLKAMALPYTTSENLICTVIDARRDQVYYGVYDSNLKEVEKEYILKIDELCEKLKSLNKKIIFTGDCVEKHRKLIVGILGENAVFPNKIFHFNNAVNVAALAQEKYLNKKMSGISPEYILKSYVEKDG